MNETKLDLDKVNPVDISILKNEFKKKITENVDGQVLVLDSNKGQESDKKRQKMNENLTTFPENFQCSVTIPNTSKLPQKCALCNKMISPVDDLKSHIKKVHGSKMPDDVKMGNFYFQFVAPSKTNESDKKINVLDLNKEKFEISKATKRNFCCEICNVEATSQGQLDVHLAGKKHFKNLKSHVEKDHESKKPDNSGNGKFRCEICDVETSDQGQLDKHFAGKKHFKKTIQEAAHYPEK